MARFIFGLIFGTVCLAYLVYCLREGRTHAKGRGGWVTKEESPKGFMFAMILYFVLGVSSLGYNIFMYLRSGS